MGILFILLRSYVYIYVTNVMQSVVRNIFAKYILLYALIYYCASSFSRAEM